MYRNGSWPTLKVLFCVNVIECVWRTESGRGLFQCWPEENCNNNDRCALSRPRGKTFSSQIQFNLQLETTPSSIVLPEKLRVLELLKKLPAFYGIRRIITAFTTAHHVSISWARWIQSTPSHPIYFLKSLLILYSYLCLGLPSGFFPSGLPTKTAYATLLSSKRATCPAHLILLDLITRTVSVSSTDHKALVM